MKTRKESTPVPRRRVLTGMLAAVAGALALGGRRRRSPERTAQARPPARKQEHDPPIWIGHM